MFEFFKKTNIVKGKRNEDLPLTHSGLPDSYTPNGLCPRCGKQSSFEFLGYLPVTFSNLTVQSSNKTISPSDCSDRVISLICRHCQQGIAVIEEKWVGDHQIRLGIGKGGTVSFRGVHWWPLPQSIHSDDIPQFISSIYDEAIITYYAEAPRATAVMLRRTIEAIAAHFGETKDSLAKRLQNLSDKNILQPTLSDWAKEIRLIGNKGAHYDPANDVTMKDIRQLLAFVQDLMKYLFELPAELMRRKNI